MYLSYQRRKQNHAFAQRTQFVHTCTEVEDCSEKIRTIKEELKILLLPKDKNDDRNCIMEIRGGAGGEEAALFYD